MLDSTPTPTEDLFEYLVPVPKTGPVLTRASGVRIEDEDGNAYLDFEAGPGVMSVGHCHPHVVAAVQAQAEVLLHHSGKYHGRLAPALAKRLAALTGDRLNRAFFANSGAEANDGALKLALKRATVTGKQGYGIIALEHGYHGRLSLPLSATGMPEMKIGMGPYASFPGIVHVPVPYFYRCGFGSTTPEECGNRHAAALRSALQTRVPGEAAVMIAEPILGVGGVIIPPDNYWPQVAEICHENDITLIMDEVFVGFGRTGKMFGHELWGIAPDIITFAKAIGGGLPLGGFVTSDEVANCFESNDHNTTFGVNGQLSIAAAHAVLDIVEQERLAERAEVCGNRLMEGFAELAAMYPMLGEARGRGLVIGIEIVSDSHARTPSPELAKALQSALRENGLLLGVGGANGNVMRLSPPLTLTDDDVEESLDIFARAFATVAANA